MTWDHSLDELRTSYERALKLHPAILVFAVVFGAYLLKISIPFLALVLFWPPYIAWGFFSALSLDSKIVVGLILGYSFWNTFLSVAAEFLVFVSSGVVITGYAFLSKVLPKPKRRGVDRFGVHTEFVELPERTLLSLKEEGKRR